MNSIIAIATELLKSNQSFIQFEAEMIPALAEFVCAAVSKAIEVFDDELCLGKDWTILRKDKRTIQCLFGTLVFSRRLVRDGAGKPRYPLDEALGIPKSRRYSPLLMARVASLSSHAVLRTVSRAVEAFTPGSMSFQTVDKIYQEIGEDLIEVATSKAAAPKQKNEKACTTQLFIEGDAFQVKIKHGLRVMVHRLQVSEGVILNGKRHILKQRYIISGLNRRLVFEQMSEYLDSHYDCKNTQIITGSDNGSGYEPSAFQVFSPTKEQHVHVLDAYHLNRKLKERFSLMPMPLKKRLRQAVFAADKPQVKMILDTAESIATNGDYRDDVADNIKRLRDYLNRNWDSIKPLAVIQWRHSGLGSCESNHRAYTYRLKKQGRSWSITGLKAMLMIIDAEQNGELERSLSQTTMFNAPQRLTDNGQIVIAPNFKLRALFAVGKHSAHVGVKAGVINAQGVTGTSFGRFARAMNDLN